MTAKGGAPSPQELGLRLVACTAMDGELDEHARVQRLERKIGEALFGQAVGTTVRVPELGLHYFLVQTGALAVELFCAPYDDASEQAEVDDAQMMEARLLAYAGTHSLAAIERALGGAEACMARVSWDGILAACNGPIEEVAAVSTPRGRVLLS